MNLQLHRNLFDTFLYNPLTPFFKGESGQMGKLFNHDSSVTGLLPELADYWTPLPNICSTILVATHAWIRSHDRRARFLLIGRFSYGKLNGGHERSYLRLRYQNH